MTTIYHGIDSEIYKPVTNETKEFIFTISHFTKNHIQRKRLFEIVKAAKIVIAKFPKQKFVIAGAMTSAINTLKEFIKDAGVENNFILLQGVSEREKLDYLRRSIIYLQPTLHEAFGVAIAEAMSCGVPVISSKSAAVPEVLGDTGLYANPYDAGDIAKRIIILLENCALREKMGSLASERIKDRFSYNNRKEAVFRLLNEIL